MLPRKAVPAIAGTFHASALGRERRVVTGLRELDEVLPHGGLVAGSLVDLHADEGAGAFELALRIAAGQQATGRSIVVVDARGDFYAPAAVKAGVLLERLIVIRGGVGLRGVRGADGVAGVAGRRDAAPPRGASKGGGLPAARSKRAAEAWLLACLDEALRSKAVAAVIAPVKRLDGPSSHRLRVAAEAGGGLGLLLRPLDERTAVSASAVRLVVSAVAPASPFGERGLALEPLRVRGGVALGPRRVS